MVTVGGIRGAATALGEALVRRILSRLVTVALGYRAVVTLVAVAITAGSTEVSATGRQRLIGVAAGIVVVHLGLIATGARRETRTVGSILPAADIAIAVLLNLWASSAVIPDGSLYRGFGDPFGAYAIGTLALWSALRGPRTGAVCLVSVMLPLQFAMAIVNRAELTSADWARFVMRSLWLTAAVIVGSLLWNVLRSGRVALAVQSAQAGRQAQYRRTLDTLHNVVLQTLLGIGRRAADRGIDPGRALDEISDECTTRSVEVRRLLETSPSGTNGGVVSELGRLAEGFARQTGMNVTFVSSADDLVLAPHTTDALVAAAGEAVRNSWIHGSARHVELELAADHAWSTLIARDDGTGTNGADEGYGIRHVIRAGLAGVGGSASLSTSAGTTWTMKVPVAPPPGSREQTGATDLAPLVEQTMSAAAFIPLSYRAIGLLIAAAGLVGSRSLGPIQLGPVLTALGGLLVVQLVLIHLASRNPSLHHKRWSVVGDVVLLAGVSVWTASVLPPGTVFLDNRDPLTVYTQGTVALWTGFGSTGLGVFLLLLFALPMQLLNAEVNGVGSVDWLTLTTRGLWFVAAFLLARGIRSVVNSGGGLLAEEWRRGGMEAERAEVLKASGQEVVTTLDDIGRRSREPGTSPAAILEEIGSLSWRRAAQVRRMLNDQPSSQGFQTEMEALVPAFDGQGAIHVELVTVDLNDVVSSVATGALATATGELLSELAAGHVRTVIVFVERSGTMLRAVVTDPSPAPLSEALDQELMVRLHAVGGGLRRSTARGGPTRWEAWIPSAG